MKKKQMMCKATVETRPKFEWLWEIFKIKHFFFVQRKMVDFIYYFIVESGAGKKILLQNVNEKCVETLTTPDG